MRAPGAAAARSTSRATTATPSSPTCSLEVSKQSAERGERREACGLGAQHPRAEARGHEAGGEQRGFLLAVEAGFRPRSDGEVLAGTLHRLREAQLGGRR